MGFLRSVRICKQGYVGRGCSRTIPTFDIETRPGRKLEKKVPSDIFPALWFESDSIRTTKQNQKGKNSLQNACNAGQTHTPRGLNLSDASLGVFPLTLDIT